MHVVIYAKEHCVIIFVYADANSSPLDAVSADPSSLLHLSSSSA